MPAYYAAAKANIAGPTREHTQLAIEQNRGALAVFGPELETQIAGSKLSPAERSGVRRSGSRPRAQRSRTTSRGSRRSTRKLASGDVTARSFRLGRELYAQEVRVRHPIRRHAPRRLYAARARREGSAARAHGAARRPAVAEVLSERRAARRRLDKIGRVIARLAEQHVRARASSSPAVERQIPELERWVREHELDRRSTRRKPLDGPRDAAAQARHRGREHRRAGALRSGRADLLQRHAARRPARAERAESWLREYNDWMLPILNIHEAVPGHYVQLVYANKSPSLIKSIFGNGAMIEGWAVYTERMMLESGYGELKAEAWLIYSKWNLRSVCNTILDYGVHVLGMSEAEAMDLLTRQAFQTEQEAADKWRRVKRTSVQLTSYFSGYAAILDLRERLKRERGDTFDLKRFHEQFLSYGNAPVRVIRELMGAR